MRLPQLGRVGTLTITIKYRSDWYNNGDLICKRVQIMESNNFQYIGVAPFSKMGT
jgi:hypothetical protein